MISARQWQYVKTYTCYVLRKSGVGFVTTPIGNAGVEVVIPIKEVYNNREIEDRLQLVDGVWKPIIAQLDVHEDFYNSKIAQYVGA